MITFFLMFLILICGICIEFLVCLVNQASTRNNNNYVCNFFVYPWSQAKYKKIKGECNFCEADALWKWKKVTHCSLCGMEYVVENKSVVSTSDYYKTENLLGVR